MSETAEKKLTVADVDAKLAELAAKVAELEAMLAGFGEQSAKLIEEALAPFVDRLEAATPAPAQGDELASFVDHVNAKVHAIHNALQRAVGIDVPLPLREDPADKPVGDITVTGAETAQT